MEERAEQAKKSKGSGCLKALGIGCLVIVVLVLAVIGLIWSQWDEIKESDWFRNITEMAETARTEMGYMMELRQSLLSEYPAGSITLQVQQKSGSSGGSISLVVNFVNPEFPVPDSNDGKENTAWEIALKVAGRYPEIERYDRVTISFVAQKGAGVTFKTTKRYPFPTAELLEAIKNPGSVG